jgi:hypothetical protein
MQRKLALSILATLAITGFTAASFGQSPNDRSMTGLPGQPGPGNSSTNGEICVPDYDILVRKLQASYAEVPVSAGLGQDGNLVSIFASPDTGTWTMVMTRPEGTSCVVAVGQAWQSNSAAFGPPA